jgi:hypothetical protein
MEKGENCKVKITELRPSQGAVGMRDVLKRESLAKEALTDEKMLKQYLKSNRVDIVIGPEGEFYLIDGHHHALAMNRADVPYAYAKIRKNFYGWDPEDFWDEMEERGWVRLKDEKGKRISRKKLPRRLKNLKVDPYRSLARAVQKSGAVFDHDVTMAEFEWADYYRRHIPLKDLKKNWDESVKKAIKLSFRDEASDFPGHRPIKRKKRKGAFVECWLQFRELAHY